jgi:hypothetical protein
VNDKLTCAECGVEMNRHAEKLDVFAAIGIAAAWDDDLGGSVEQLFCCPRCGNIDSVHGN